MPTERLQVVARVHHWTRLVLLGRQNGWGATLGTGPLAIYMLALLAMFAHALDLASGLRMMVLYGVHLEQNPVARMIMDRAGPFALIEVKLAVVFAALLLLIRTAEAGRPRLARNCIMVALALGLLGFASNLVG